MYSSFQAITAQEQEMLFTNFGCNLKPHCHHNKYLENNKKLNQRSCK